MSNYKIKPLVLAMALATPAFAQEAAEEVTQQPDQQGQVLEEVAVTGFRQSLEQALDTKRTSANNTDSIIAEDIGKMPDLNLAESLQRVPGVAITREGGEGRNITVRGLGPGFSRTTLNGMEVPASTGGLDTSGGVNRSRDFDFNIFASELFNRITIHKSPIASVEEGGLASTVELSTARPFDNPGQHFSFGGQMMVDSFAEKESPRFVGLYSNTFMDDKLGVLVSAAYSERSVRQEGFGTVRWTSPFDNGNRSWAGTDADVIIHGTPNPQANYPDDDIKADEKLDYMWAPRLPRMDSFNREQERLGLTGSLQFRPSDSMAFSLDVLNSNLKADVTSYNYFAQFRNSFNGITPLEVTLDESGRNIVAGTFAGVKPRSESRGQFSETDFTQVVLSGKFDLTENVVLDVMYGNAVSKHTEDQLRFNIEARDASTFSYSFLEDGDIAEMSYGFDILNPDNYVFSGPTLRRDVVERTNDTVRADLTFNGDSSVLKTGLIWNSREVDSERWDPTRGTLSSPTLTAALTTQLANEISGFGSGIDSPSGFPTNWLVNDFNATKQAYGVGQWTLNDNDSSTYNVVEETLGGYVEATVETQLLGLPLTVNSGLRIVETSTDVGNLPEDSYTEILPSTNLVLELQEDLLLRVGLARNFARPGLGGLAATTVTPVRGTVSAANPEVEPMRADSADVSLEWYFDAESVLALTVFHKQIDSFLTSVTVNDQELPAELAAIVAARPEYDPASPLYDANVENPYSSGWDITTTVNGEGATVDGYEISYQQPLSFLPGWGSNFGVLANFTHVKSNAEYGNGVRGPLEGLSENSYNFGVYYEEDRFGARVVVNDRDDYVTSGTGGEGNASFATTGPTRVDMSAFYDVTDNIKVSLEAINLTNETERLYTTGPMGDQDLVREYNSTGREVLLGLRVNF
ncbi:TonB-dependent receptor [Microbulbifer sp.]|uniref:TonB-dependent receptor n=1 Tax=Microbulbifer sp. TaxID=1908541 RepID=UPI002F95A2B6